MPRTPIDYSKSVIYTIIHVNDTSLNYVGSTTSFVDRKKNHKKDCKSSQFKLYVMVRDNGGWDNFIMKPYKVFPCNSSIELHIEEERCRIELNATLNSQRCYTTEEQKKEQNLENSKDYYDLKKEEILEKHKEKYTCECGSVLRKSDKSTHNQTKKHIKYLATATETEQN